MIYILYPILLCCLPVHCLYAQNLHELSVKDYLMAIAFIACLTIGGVFGFYCLSKNINCSLLVFCIDFYILLYANYFYIRIYSAYKREVFKNKIFFVLFILSFCCFLSIGLFILLKNINLFYITKILFYCVLILTFLLIIDILQRFKSFNKNAVFKMKYKNENLKDMPDIYHIILDMHPGFAVDEFCDAKFKDALEERGFCVYKNFKSNYTRTNLSVTSLLNMDYIDNIANEQKKAYFPEDVIPFYKKNFVFSFLREQKYNFTIFANMCFNKLFTKEYTNPNDFVYRYKFQSGLLRILFFSSIFFIMHTKSCLKSEILNPLNTIKQRLTKKSFGSQYVYLHLLAPHPPYYCDEKGRFFRKNERIDIKNYLSYTKFIDNEIIKFIDEIQLNMKKNSLIILHSDHGQSDLESRHDILMAVYYPDKKERDVLPEDGTLVNLFRYIFNRYFKTDFCILKNKFYKSNITDFVVYEDVLE